MLASQAVAGRAINREGATHDPADDPADDDVDDDDEAS
jgi:hypothetical protein